MPTIFSVGSYSSRLLQSSKGDTYAWLAKLLVARDRDARVVADFSPIGHYGATTEYTGISIEMPLLGLGRSDACRVELFERPSGRKSTLGPQRLGCRLPQLRQFCLCFAFQERTSPIVYGIVGPLTIELMPETSSFIAVSLIR